MSQPLSFSSRVSDAVLSTCRARDEPARTLTTVRPSLSLSIELICADSSNAVTLLRALRDLWPLARTSVIENALDGSVEAQIVVPQEADEQAQARRRAESLRCAGFLRMVTLLLLAGALALYARDVATVNQMSVNATQEL